MSDESQPSKSPAPTAATPESRGMARAYAVLALLTVGLMVLGALVRAHGAGLACPDWPLCFGEAIPRFDLKIAFEWSHRVVAGSIALVFLLLATLCLRKPVLRRRVGGLIVFAGLVLALQIFLGALTVWELLASWSVTSHLLTANAFVVSLSFLAVRLSEQAGPPVRPHTVSTGTLCLISGTLALLVLQVTLGGLMASTYAGLVCPDWPTCIDGTWFPGWEGARGLHLLHRVVAYALVGALCGCAILTRADSALGRLLRVALALGGAQVVVGVANVLLRLPVEVTALHSLLAALLMIVLALATREAWLSR